MFQIILHPVCSYIIGNAVPVITHSPKDDASDDESEDGTSSRAPLTDSSSAIPREIISSNTTIKLEPPESRDESEDEGENDEVDVDETQSHNSSSRDSRSPIVFNRSPKERDNPKPRSPSPASAISSDEEEAESEHSSSEDEEEETPKAAEKVIRVEVNRNEDDMSLDSDQASNSDDSECDEEEPSKVVQKAARNNIVRDENDVASSSDEDSDEQDDESDQDEEPQVQVPKSSPDLPPHRQFVKPALSKLASKPNQNHSKGPLHVMSINTQDEVDQQLTSSIYEARSARSSSIPNPIPASSAVAPKMGFGTSLSSLLTKTLAQSSAAKVNGAILSSQKLQLAQQEEEESEESEEESDEDDDDGSSEEEVKLPKGKSPTLRTSKASSQKQNSEKNSDDSDSDSDSNGDDEERTRQELFSQINAVTKEKGASQISFPSPQAYRSGTQDVGKVKKVEKRKSDRFLTGYQFNAPA
jgi:hypothetical protein